jgi:hypothetical protein
MNAATGIDREIFWTSVFIGKKFCHPTGKSFKLPMCSIGIRKNVVMIEEHRFEITKLT